MLHSIEPKAFIAPELLPTVARCPCCGTESAISDGVVGLLHYTLKDQVKHSLVWVCQPICILDFEHSRFMGRA